jgi:hypothetical protein
MIRAQPSIVMPLFVFDRRSHVEREAGFILAGQLFVDVPNKAKLKGRDHRNIREIIGHLTSEAQSGRMPIDGMVVGWHGGVKPPNAVDVRDDAIMAAWAAKAVSIVVRIDPRKDGRMRTDSDMLRQMGMPKHNA